MVDFCGKWRQQRDADRRHRWSAHLLLRLSDGSTASCAAERQGRRACPRGGKRRSDRQAI